MIVTGKGMQHYVGYESDDEGNLVSGEFIGDLKNSFSQFDLLMEVV